MIISTTTLPDGISGHAYQQTLTATGGVSPYYWTVSSGSLPTGLSLSTTGIISGKLGGSGTATFTVQAMDMSGATATKTLTITVAENPYENLWIAHPSLWAINRHDPLAAAVTSPVTVSSDPIWIVEIEGYSRTLRVCSGRGYITRPEDTGSALVYSPRIVQPALVRREIPIPGSTTAVRVTYGELILANADGGLDQYKNEYWAGRTVTLRCGRPSDPYPAGFPVQLVAMTESARFGLKEVTLKLKSPRSAWEQPLHTALYGGTNSNGSGIDGESALAGTLTPLVIGNVFLMQPICVNSSKLIYQYHTPGIITTRADYSEPLAATVLEGGLELSAHDMPYADQAAMENDDPSGWIGDPPPDYRVCPTLGCFRLRATPMKKLSVQAGNGATCWGTLHALLTGPGGISGNTDRDIIGTPGFATDSRLDGPLYYNVGLAIAAGQTLSQIMDLIMQSVCGWWAYRKSGAILMGKFDQDLSASHVPDAELTEAQIISMESDEAPIANRITLRSAKNYAVHSDADLVGSAQATGWGERLKQQWQETTANTNIADLYPLASEYRLDTALTVPGAGANHPALDWKTVLGCYNSRRLETLRVTARLDSASVSALDLGSLVLMRVNRLGYSSGKRFLVVGIQADATKNRVELTLWGGI